MKLSVIIANRNDTVMLAITVRSALEEILAIPGGGEVVVCDNSDPEYKEAVKSVLPLRYLKRGDIKLIHQDHPCLFTAREAAIRAANGEYVYCVDSHCLFGRDSLVDAVHFMNRHKSEKIGFGHTPINWLCQHDTASRHDMKEVHGTWGKLYGDERKISWKGMPWICRKNWFLNELNGYGALSENRLAWGGGDMYLGLKSWLLGYENWSIVSRPVIHVGPLPVKVRELFKYRNYSESGEGVPNLGFIVAFMALTGEKYMQGDSVMQFLDSRINVNDYYDIAQRMARNDREYVMKNRVCTFEELEGKWQQSI